VEVIQVAVAEDDILIGRRDPSESRVSERHFPDDFRRRS
jgi:hypothetical protein